MNENIIVAVLKNLVGYFVMVFVGEFILEKIFAPVEAIPLSDTSSLPFRKY